MKSIFALFRCLLPYSKISQHEEITARKHSLDCFYRSDRVWNDHSDFASVRPTFSGVRMANRALAGLLFVHAVSRVAGFRMAIGSLWTKASSAVQPDWVGRRVSPDGQCCIARDIVCGANSRRHRRRQRRDGLCLHRGYHASRKSFKTDRVDRGCVWNRVRSGSRDRRVSLAISL